MSGTNCRSFINAQRSRLPFKQGSKVKQDSKLKQSSKFPSVVGQPVTKTSKIHLLKSHNTTTARKKNKHQHLSPHPTPAYHCTSHTSIPVESHVIGLDKKSSQMKCFMHLNMSQLQQAITYGHFSEPEGMTKMFRYSLRKVAGKPKSTVKLMTKTNQDASTDGKDNTSSSEHVVVCPSITQESRCVDVPGSTVQVTGQSAQIFPHECLPDLAAAKKSVSKDIRNAKEEISRTVNQVRQPPKTVTKSNPLCKDDLLLTRACTTIALSVLNTVDTINQKKLHDESMSRKIKLVSTVKEERRIRKAKIDHLHENTKEKARDWKSVKEGKLNEFRIKFEVSRNADILKCLHSYHKALQNREIQLKDLSLAHVFGVQNTMMLSVLSKKDHECLKANHAVRKQCVVKKMTEAAHERKEMVRSFMELRRKKLSQEGEEARNKLDSTLLLVRVQ